MNMILLLIVPVYLFLNYYVIRRIFHWLHLCSPHLEKSLVYRDFYNAVRPGRQFFAFCLSASFLRFSGCNQTLQQLLAGYFSLHSPGHSDCRSGAPAFKICFPYSGKILSLGCSPHTGRHLSSLSGSRRKFPGCIQCASDPHNRL